MYYYCGFICWDPGIVIESGSDWTWAGWLDGWFVCCLCFRKLFYLIKDIIGSDIENFNVRAPCTNHHYPLGMHFLRAISAYLFIYFFLCGNIRRLGAGYDQILLLLWVSVNNSNSNGVDRFVLCTMDCYIIIFFGHQERKRNNSFNWRC